MSEEETLHILSNTKALRGLTEDDLKLFYASCQKITVKDADPIIEAGQTETAFYIIISGQFRVDISGGPSKVKLNTLKAGDFFGEYSLIDQQPTSASVTATQAGELIKIPKPAFDNILEANDRIAKTIYHNMLQTLIQRLRDLNIEHYLFALNYPYRGY